MVTIIKKLTGGAYPFYEYACLSTDVKPVSLVPENSICHEIDTGKHFYFSNKAWHELPPKGGSSGGEGGGGVEKFVVTLTKSNDTWTADKTVTEILAAKDAGMIVEASAEIFPDLNARMPLVAVYLLEEQTIVVFNASLSMGDQSVSNATFTGFLAQSTESWDFRGIDMQVKLPEYSPRDDVGKVLTVTENGLAWISPSN